jgi:hypothetical protein
MPNPNDECLMTKSAISHSTLVISHFPHRGLRVTCDGCCVR